jgi:rhamnosyltransferase
MESFVAIETTPVPPVAATICAVMVTYHPDVHLFRRVEKVTQQVAQMVIVDNGSPRSCTKQFGIIADKLPIHLILNASNEGIARALNTGVRWAASQDYQWVLTLDQDTTVVPDMIDALADVFRRYPVPDRLAVIGSNYRHKVNGRVWCDDVIGSNAFPGREMKTVLTSGSLISLAAFRTIGGFREDFFIDCVDHEYCLHARAHGFHVVMTSKPIMEHGIGHLTEHRLLWKKVGVSNHSPGRQYFMTRNTLILAREYVRKEPRWVFGYLWAWVKSIAVIFLFEEQRVAKLRNIMRGFVDGVLGETRLSRLSQGCQSDQ